MHIVSILPNGIELLPENFISEERKKHPLVDRPPKTAPLRGIRCGSQPFCFFEKRIQSSGKHSNYQNQRMLVACLRITAVAGLQSPA